MKKIILTLSILFSLNNLITAQNIGINGSGAAPDPSAMLDIDVSTLGATSKKGMLIPRIALTSLTDASTIPFPVTSLLIYNTATAGVSPNDVSPGFYFWDGVAVKWRKLVSLQYLNSASVSAIGKFYSSLSWTGSWNNGTTLSFVITDPNMVCGAQASAAFVSFDCLNSNAILAGFLIRNVKCNAGNFVVSVTNNTGSNFGAGSLPITYVAFY